MQCDELWCSAIAQTAARRLERIRVRVDNKGNKQWIWLALDVKTREIIGVQIGDRDEVAAKELWLSIPPVYRQCAVAYTDFWAATCGQVLCGMVIPSKRHRAQRVCAERRGALAP